jgi:hypothetical protein
MLVPVPGVDAGVLTPTGNMATWIDQLVLGRFHHGENTCFASYLGFASSVLLGVMTGHILLSSRTATKLRLLAAASAAAWLPHSSGAWRCPSSNCCGPVRSYS